MIKANELNIEQEIWDDFKSLSESSLMDRLSYNTANAHFGVSYEDKNQLVHTGFHKKLLYDEDYLINKFLLSSDYKNVNWDELKALYPIHQKREINEIMLNGWYQKRKKLHLKIPNEKAAQEYLINIRWDDNPVCPRCIMSKIYVLNSLQFKCSKCSLKFSEKVGTIFQNSKLELVRWYEAMCLLTSIKTYKISTVQLGKEIGVTQKTSWGMAKKIQSKVNQDFITKIKHSLFYENLYEM